MVNADDLGLSPGVSSGIIEAHGFGIVTSASLISNLPASAGGAALSLEQPELGVGLHLNLTAGQPLTECPSLTWAHGPFLPLLRVLLRVGVSPRARREAWTEMEAQAEQARRFGIDIDHLDSHHHVHLFGPLRRRAARLARELGIPMRLPTEKLAASDWLRDLEAGLASYLASRARSRAGVPKGADQILGLGLHRTGYDGDALRRLLTSVPEGVTELVCHPGHADDELVSLSRYARPREDELAALTDAGLRPALEKAGVMLVNWSQVRAGR